MPDEARELRPWQHALHEVIFEADTPAGKAFDIALLLAIVLSVVAACLESVPSIAENYGPSLLGLELLFTFLFTVEYVLRLLCVGRPLRYAVSFFGIVDLLAILPTYLLLFNLDTHSLIVIRALRLMRVFRVLKLVHFIGEAEVLRTALRQSRQKIIVFLTAVSTLILILGTMMYLVEGADNPGFDSIPQSVYWAVVTMTTVGYGDVTPATVLGKALASVMMIAGYSIIAVPTGIVSVELSAATRKMKGATTQSCTQCSHSGHDADAKFCKHCGSAVTGVGS